MRLLVALLMLTTVFAGCASQEEAPAPAVEPVPIDHLSKVLYDTVLREQYEVTAQMDGISLVVDVFRPDTDEPVPIILVQSPYWAFLGDAKDSDRPTWYIDYFVPRGYAVALGEMRGTRDSGGCWDFGGPRDQQDGHDMVEALADMEWSNGNVGMLGQSHVGMSQVAAAVTAPPSLKTIVPIAAVTDWYRYLHYEGAPYVLNRATPPAYFAVHASPSTPEDGPENAPIQWALTQAQTACVDNLVHLSQSAELDGDKDAYWQERDLIAKAGDTRAAVFLVHGFLDENVKTDHFLDYWQALPEDVPKKAWFGQWYHEHPSYVEWREDLHRWYDYHLKEIPNGIMDEPTVTVQDNRMVNRTEMDWPAGETIQTWTAAADGTLRTGDVDATGATRLLVVPGDDRGTAALDAQGDSNIQSFTTDPLPSDLHLAGVGTINFTASVTGPAPRFAMALFDVAPDGSLDEITRGYLDGRHRNGPETNEEVPIMQNAPYTLKLYPRDHVVEAGHQLRLVLFGGDMGCQWPFANAASSAYVGSCEGTGVVPSDANTLVFDHGAGFNVFLPVAYTAGPERPLTPLENWLDDLPE